MTVQPADPATQDKYVRYLYAVVVAVLLPAPFVASYLIALRHNAVHEAEASVVAIAAVTLAWLVVYIWIVTRDHARSDTVDRQWPLAAVVLVPFGALIWMLLDLLDRGSAVGIWAASPIATTISSATALAAASGLSVRRMPATEEPEPAETSPSAPIDTEEPTTSGTEGAPEPGEVVTPSNHPATKSPEKRDRSLAVGVDANFWTELTRSLSSATGEQGGVALTTSVDGELVVVGAVLPQQIAATSVRCEFSVLDVERVRDALDSLGNRVSIEQVRITWLHTHPSMGVFLSGTDVATAANWRNLDPDFTPIVVDVFKAALADQIGVFGPDNQKMSPIGLVQDSIDPVMAGWIRQAVLDRYDRDNLKAPEVIVGPAFSNTAGSTSGAPAKK